jgi:hypothetical protein
MDYEKEGLQETIDNHNYIKILSFFIVQLLTVFLFSCILYEFINLEKLFTGNNGKYVFIIVMVCLIYVFFIQLKFFLDDKEENEENYKVSIFLLCLFSICEIFILTYALYNSSKNNALFIYVIFTELIIFTFIFIIFRYLKSNNEKLKSTLYLLFLSLGCLILSFGILLFLYFFKWDNKGSNISRLKKIIIASTISFLLPFYFTMVKYLQSMIPGIIFGIMHCYFAPLNYLISFIPLIFGK